MNTMTFNHANFLQKPQLTNCVSEGILRVPFIRMRRDSSTNGTRFVTCSKTFADQDFQDFAKPFSLLPATKPNTYTGYLPKDLLSSLELDILSSFYTVELSTSRDFDSSLRDTNAAILLCLIDSNGNSILQRVTMLPLEQPTLSEGMDSGKSVPFQRGSVDVVTFMGSRLEKIDAVWIGLESGSWRLDGVRLTVINQDLNKPLPSEDTEEDRFSCLQYEFEVHNTLLGEKGVPIAELRPVSVREISREDFFTFLNNESSRASSLDSSSADAGMRDYADLKFSLLVYDLFLVSTGSSILMLSLSNREALSFLFGGIVGFIYLLQLQRSVDGLPAPQSENDGKFVEEGRGFQRQWLVSAVVVAAFAVALRYRMEGELEMIRPLELFIGVGGFFTSKAAVVLAAIRPIGRNLLSK